MDYSLFKIINDFAVSYPLAGGIAILFSTYMIFALPAGAFFLGKKWRYGFIALFASAFIAYAVNAAIGYAYFRPRPFVDHPVVKLISKSSTDKSFPSDHTALAFAIAAALFYFDRRVGGCVLLLAAGIGIGRIAVGVHYPSDILAGMVAGIGSAYAAHKILIGNKHPYRQKYKI